MPIPVPIPPSWDAVHPLIIHFPIALLLVAPLFVFLGMILPKNGRSFLYAALILMAIGTLSACVAVSTGRAAAELADRTPEIAKVLETHEELAELTRNLFSGLTVLFAGILFVPALLKKNPGFKLSFMITAAFLAVYMLASLAVVWTGHEGGRLVHQYGVRALSIAG